MNRLLRETLVLLSLRLKSERGIEKQVLQSKSKNFGLEIENQLDISILKLKRTMNLLH